MIGKRLKELRKRKEVSQEELAKVLDITTSAVGQYEIDARNPSFDVLIKMSKYFCVSTDWILGISENESEFANVPSDYALIVSNALEHGISADKLKRLIDFSKELEGK